VDVKQLSLPLPPKEAFDCHRLKEFEMSDEDYKVVQQIWTENNMTNMGQLLSHYNRSDTQGFLTAVDNMQAFWRTLKLDGLKGKSPVAFWLSLANFTVI